MSTSPDSSDYLPYTSDSSGQRESSPHSGGSFSRTDEEICSFSDDDFVPKRKRLILPFNIKRIPDRISTLPDSILHHILSFLPVERAITTAVLSKRWQYLWTYLPNLHFHNPWGPTHSSDFVRFVDKTLIQCGGAKINRFVVDFRYDSRFDSNISLWIRFAVKNYVEELTLDLFWGYSTDKRYLSDYYLLPEHLYKNSTLTKLSLSVCDLTPKGCISWKSLKRLSIGCTKLSDDVMMKILSGSPVLESLELYDFHGIDKLNITNPVVKSLVVRDYYGKIIVNEEDSDDDMDANEYHDLGVLEIWAPNIISLQLLCSFSQNKCRLMNVESLVEANLNFSLVNVGEQYDEAYIEMLIELLGKLHHVKSLTMGTWCIQVLSILEKVGQSSPLSKLNTLMLDTRIKKQDLFGITNLLASSPDLQTLIINMNPLVKSELCSLTSLHSLHNLTDEKRVFNCLSLNLKQIKILNFSHIFFTFDLLRFLLEKSKVLEKVIIQAPSTTSSEIIIRTTKELLSFPRASPRAVILFSN